MERLHFNCHYLKLCCTGIFLIAVAIQAIELCVDSRCSSPECTKTDCYHGTCNSDGECICDACWEGPSCNNEVNRNIPLFEQETYEASIPASVSLSQPIVQVHAYDLDLEFCESRDNCACAEIKYAIDQGNEDGVYRIDTKTGEIFLTEQPSLDVGFRQYLTVSAENPSFGSEGAKGSRATVFIHSPDSYIDHLGMHGYAGFQASYDNIGYSEAFPESVFSDPSVHSRSKREVDTVLSDLTPRPENVTFHLEKTGDYANVTSMRVGTRVHFLLAIQFPARETDMLVELFTPDNETTVMVLCNVRVAHVGSHLGDLTPADFPVVLEAKDPGSYDYDRAIIDFGNITNNGSADDVTQEVIVIEWDAVMIDNDETVNQSVYWVSAGAEYNNDNEIWVGQASFTVNIDHPTTSEIPDFNLTGPDTVMVGASSVYTLNMHIPYASARLYIDAFGPLDDPAAISVCSVLVVDVGSHYNCVPKDYLDYTETAGTTCDACNEWVRLDLGTVTNAGFDEAGYTTDDIRLTLAIAYYVSNTSAVVGELYTLSVAVQIGDTPSEIWAGNINVTVVDDILAEGVTSHPDLSLTTVTDSPVVVDQAVVYELTMTVPENSEGTYRLEILAPYNESAARMKICEVSLLRKGVNVPCFTDQKPVYSSRDNSSIDDRVIWNIGRIRNNGHRDGTIDTTANKITFKIVTSVLNHTMNEQGETLWIIAGMDIDDDRLWVGSNSIEVALSNNVSEARDAPAFNISYAFGNDVVAVGASTNVTLTISTQPGNVHTPMDMEIIMPFADNAPIIRICKAEIISAGKNLPCFDREEKNATIQYSNRVNMSAENFDVSTIIYDDKAILSLGPLCNIDDGTSTDQSDHDIQINYIVQLLRHPNVSEGWSTWLNEGVAYSPSNIWVGQLQLTATEEQQSYAPGLSPEVHVTRENETAGNDLGKGLTAVYHILMKVPPQSTADYRVQVAVSTGMSVCHIRVTEIGSSFPCLSPGDFVGNYTEHPGTYDAATGFIDFGPLSNVGPIAITNDTEFDENSITMEVIVRMLEDTTGAQTVDVTVDYGDSTHSTEQIVLDPVDITSVTTQDNIPEISFYPFPVNENQTAGYEIAKGQSLLYRLDLLIPEGAENDLSVKFLTPVDFPEALEVCAVSVIHVGANLPCLTKQAIDDTAASRSDSTYIDTREVSLGHVCQHTLVNDTNENLVTVEAVVRANLGSDLEPGDAVWLSSTIRINNDHIAVSQMRLNLTITEDFNETDHDINAGDISLTDSAIAMQPGEIRDIDMVITVPPNCSVLAYLDVQAAVNTSAIFTIRHIEVTSAGTNVGCMAGNSKKEFNTTYNSTQDTTQMDYAVFNLGILTNSGTTYRKGTFEDEDNQFNVTVQIQMADAVEGIGDSEHALSIGLSMGSNVYVLETNIAVTRDGTEIPDIILEANMTTSVTYGVEHMWGNFFSDVIALDALLYHTNESQAEGYNTTASFYFPPFMLFRQVTFSNLSISETTNASGSHGVSFVFGTLFFTDIASFSFEIEVAADEELPFSDTEVNSTTPYEAGCQIIPRTPHDNASGTWFVSRVDQLSFKITGPNAATFCDAEPLGMADGTLQDCQISGSHSIDDTSQVTDARPNEAGWKFGVRAGNFIPFLQVYFGNRTKVLAMAITHGAGCRPTALEVKYSDDGVIWESLGYSIPVDQYLASERFDFLTSVEARYIQVHIANHTCTNAEPALRAEFHGCVMSSDVPVSEVCSNAGKPWMDYSPDSEVYIRGFLAVDNHWYYCDEIPDQNNKMACFMSDAGNSATWTTVDEVVMNIIGYDRTVGELYGIAWDKRSFMTSPDWGFTWYSVDRRRYEEARVSEWVQAVEIPWKPSDDFTSSPYTSGGMRAIYEGITDGGTQVVSWEDCCT